MGIRDTSYYGWRNVKNFDPEPAFSGANAWTRINSMVEDPYGFIYAGGRSAKYTGVGTANDSIYWVVYRSKNNGDTWELVDEVQGRAQPGFPTQECQTLAVDANGVIYAGGADLGYGRIRRSADQGKNWEDVDWFGYRYDTGEVTSGSMVMGLATSGSVVYACGFEQSGTTPLQQIIGVVRKSDTGLSGTFVGIDSFSPFGSSGSLYRTIAVGDTTKAVYVGGEYKTDFPGVTQLSWIIRSSSSGLSGTFGTIDTFSRILANLNGGGCFDIAVSGGAVYAVGTETTSSIITNMYDGIVRKSTNGASGSFTYIYSTQNPNNDMLTKIHIANNGEIYLGGVLGDSPGGGAASGKAVILRSRTGLSASFETVTVYQPGTAITAQYVPVLVTRSGYIFFATRAGVAPAAQAHFIRRGKLTANSASIGPMMMATTIGYVQSENISGSQTEKFKLNNVSEFPHSSGLFQMRNIILGTQTTGKIGKTDDSIVQLTYIGSTVKVMWPKQDTIDKPIKGFGDFSAGERSGKLTTDFQPGDAIDVTEFDHLTLYGYLRKQLSGTSDNVVITVERKPLTDLAFARDQAIEYQSSGSYTVANLTDLVYKKRIDYGDLSLREIGFPIDIPLTNVKEVRISVKHENGQSQEENKNFIVWGRLIKASKDTNET